MSVNIEEGRDRARDAYRRRMSELGWGATEVAAAGDISDPATVRAFVAGDSWPWAKNRKKLEAAVEWPAGTLDELARGGTLQTEGKDPVVSAVEQSALTRANQHKLIGTYFQMLDDQGEAVRGA